MRLLVPNAAKNKKTTKTVKQVERKIQNKTSKGNYPYSGREEKTKTNLKIYRWELFNSGSGESAITGVG